MRRFALPLLISSLTACSSAGPVVVTAIDTFCTRIDRYHATEAERDVLKANESALERLIRWVAGINKQYDDDCLKPKPGP